MPRAMMTNHFAGTMFAMRRSGQGMLSTGKMKPESRIDGSIVPASAPSIATRCDDVREEMSMPNDNDVEDVEHALGEEQHEAAAERHAEDETRLGDDEQHAHESDDEIRRAPCRR